MNPIRLVSGAVMLPAHAAAAVIGTSVGLASTGVRTTARVVGRAVEQVSRGGHAPSAPPAPWDADRRRTSVPTPAPPPAATPNPVPVTEAPATGAAPVDTLATEPATTTAATKAPAKAPAKKAPATKAPAKKAAKKTAKKAAKRAPSKQAAVLAPALGLSESEVEAVTSDDPVTPAGIPAAGEGVNPDTTETDLHQPGTEPLMDPATVKAVASESEVLRRGADTDKG